MKVPLSRPDVGSREIQLVNEVLTSTQLALGPKITEFEAKIAQYVGRRFAIAVNSGTSGLHLLIRAYDIANGDEVITTPFSFVASSNVALYEAARPVFVDVDEKTANIDPNQIEHAVGGRTRAILPVDAFGQPASLDEVRDIAQRHDLVLIEDACEAIGAEWQGIKAGNGAWSDAAVFAFYPNKQITTGEGGMIVTDDERIDFLCRSMRNQGRGDDGAWLNHERLGYNYRLDEMSAALGLAQMERIEEILAKRSYVAQRYNDCLKGVDGVRIPYVSPKATMSWFVYVVRLDQQVNRDAVMHYLLENGVGCRPYFTPIHLQPFYRQTFGFKEGDFPVSEALGNASLALPFYNNLSDEEMDYVIYHLQHGIERFQR